MNFVLINIKTTLLKDLLVAYVYELKLIIDLVFQYKYIELEMQFVSLLVNFFKKSSTEIKIIKIFFRKALTMPKKRQNSK